LIGNAGNSAERPFISAVTFVEQFVHSRAETLRRQGADDPIDDPSVSKKRSVGVSDPASLRPRC
jgi:hypothetical protein